MVKSKNVENVFISVVSPVYNAEKIVDQLIFRISEEITKICGKYEIILIDDGSQDKSWQKIKNQCKTNEKVKGIKLSKNFGQHYAITAGLNYVNGTHIVVMDCDLQDNPKYINKLIKKSNEGYDVVFTIKKKRKHNLIKNFLSFCFYGLYNILKKNEIDPLDNKIGAYCLIKWLGFSSISIPIEHEKRFEGSTTYNFKKSFSLALNTIISNSDKLLKHSIITGFLFILIGILASAFIIYRSYFFGFLPGWASLMVLIIACTGLILFTLGILGIYIGKIFMEVKRRPLYIIEKKQNL